MKTELLINLENNNRDQIVIEISLMANIYYNGDLFSLLMQNIFILRTYICNKYLHI